MMHKGRCTTRRTARPGARPTVAPLALLVLAGALLGGCQMEYRVTESGWDKWKKIFESGGQNSEADSLRGDEWTIALHRYTGPHRQNAADQLIDRVERQTSLGDLWTHDDGGTTTVYFGQFSDPKKAQNALRQARGLVMGGQRTFASAQLVTLSGGESSSTASQSQDDLNLKQYPGRFTLQIGYFGDQYDGDRHEAAESEARALREQGHKAYYYHGPYRSLVTIGAYTRSQAFVSRDQPNTKSATVDAYAPRIHQLQERFPYNLGNKTNLAEQHKQEHPDAQPSGLVRVH